jgi:hypothetical protein
MTKFIVTLLLVMSLTGCGTMFKPWEPPKAPKSMLVQCPELSEIKQPHNLQNLSLSVLDNYTKYHLCRAQVDSWIDWYNTLHKKDK